MKKILLFTTFAFVMAFVFTACTSKPNLDAQAAAALQQQAATPKVDTAGFAQFQAWKAQNELADVQEFNQPEQYTAPVKTAKKTYQAPVRKTTKPRASASQASSSNNNSVNTNTNTSSSTSADTNDSGTITSESGETAKAEKKGISKAAKGAVIGGVVGAVGGAVINKDNRVAGAVIGGIIGAGGGYAIGRGMDRKDGRIEMMP